VVRLFPLHFRPLPARHVPDGENGNQPAGGIHLIVEMVAATTRHENLSDVNLPGSVMEAAGFR
jgi:hypothetical protein